MCRYYIYYENVVLHLLHHYDARATKSSMKICVEATLNSPFGLPPFSTHNVIIQKQLSETFPPFLVTVTNSYLIKRYRPCSKVEYCLRHIILPEPNIARTSHTIPNPPSPPCQRSLYTRPCWSNCVYLWSSATSLHFVVISNLD